MKRETTFENAKVGDRVWSAIHGWAKIHEIRHGATFPIGISTTESNIITPSFTIDGRYYENKAQCLFWDEIKFEAPERPARVVEKTVKMYGILLPDQPILLHATPADPEIGYNETEFTVTYKIEE